MKPCRWSSVAALTAVALLGPTLTACGDGEETQRTETLSPERAQRTRQQLPQAVVARLDSGNAAYRNDDYEAARRHFRRALERDSTIPSAWFGVYMSEKALGNEEAAERALKRAGDLSGAASMAHPAPDTEAEAGGDDAGDDGSS